VRVAFLVNQFPVVSETFVLDQVTGMIDRGILDAAIRAQSEALEHRSLGQILMSSGSIDAEGLRQVIATQIEQAVSEVMVWETGGFEFELDQLEIK